MEDTENIDKKKVKRKPRGRKIRRVEKPKKKDITPERKPKKIGYMRVSTEKQDMALQLDALVAAGVAPEDIYRDTISGSKITREGRDACLKALIAGDTLCVWKLDRFSRSLKDILDKLDMLMARGVRFVSLTQNLDTQTPVGRAMIQMIGIFAEFERETIRERVKAGIRAKIESGEVVRWGRRPQVEYENEEIVRLLQSGMTQREVARTTGVSKTTVQRVWNRYNSTKRRK